MNYKQTLEYLFSQLPMFHRIGPAAYKANLDNTIALAQYLGNPHQQFPSVHVAGTNGKGSVTHMLAAIFQEQGYKTGLATSPHLSDFRERIRINGVMIPRSYVAGFITKHKAFFEELRPSFFELSIALTFRYFADQQVDIAIIETGLGGRLDSTNIVDPEVSVITNIGLDHTNLLGNTLEKIAGEKAGIIKKEVPVIIGKRQPEIHHVFEQMASRNESPLYVASECYIVSSSRQESANGKMQQVISFKMEGKPIEVVTDLLGHCQAENLATVLKTIDVINLSGRFSVSEKTLKTALPRAGELSGLRGRWHIMGKRPLIIADTAHNTDGIKQVIRQLLSLPCIHLRIIFGMVDDKDVNSVLALMPHHAEYYFCKPDVPRGLDVRELARLASSHGLNGRIFGGVKEALSTAKSEASGKDVIFIGGSTFVVAEVV